MRWTIDDTLGVASFVSAAIIIGFLIWTALT